MISHCDPPAFAVLWQRFERLLYAYRTMVAMQRDGYFHQCAPRHKARVPLKISTFLERYPPSWRSRRARFSVRLTERVEAS